MPPCFQVNIPGECAAIFSSKSKSKSFELFCGLILATLLMNVVSKMAFNANCFARLRNAGTVVAG